MNDCHAGRIPGQPVPCGVQAALVQNRNLSLAVGSQRAVRTSEDGKLFALSSSNRTTLQGAVEEFERVSKPRAELPNEPNNEPIDEPEIGARMKEQSQKQEASGFAEPNPQKR
jgi:hypothetical protein